MDEHLLPNKEERLHYQIQSGENLAIIASNLTRWQEVRPYLGLNEADEEAIACNYRTVERQRLGLLEKWRERYGVQATYKKLAEGFHRAGRLDLVDDVCNVVRNLPAVSPEAIDRGQRHVRCSGLMLGFTVLLVVTVFCIVVMFWSPMLNVFSGMTYRFNMQVYSKSLPYSTKHFVGREKELDEIAQLIDFDNSNTRLVSVVGPPGIGKSTIAIHVGHMMVERGVGVHYVSMIEVLSMQALAEKLLLSDESYVVIRNITVERLYRWARNRWQNTLLILNDCDKVLHDQKDNLQEVVEELLASSPHIKLLMTSRQKMLHLGQFQRYELHELSMEASCDLLQTVTKLKGVEVNLSVCQTIANLTGRFPLALQVVGALLSQPNSPEPMTIIRKLKEHLIPTLSPEALPSRERVNVSIQLSYQYLSRKQKKIGMYLANFPGSFNEDFACRILQTIFNNSYSYDCFSIVLDELVQRSLLEFNKRTARFQFHTLIRQFFLDAQRSKEPQRFSVHFQYHCAMMLCNLTRQFEIDHVRALAKLDKDRHNIQHLLSEVTARPEHFIHPVYLTVVEVYENALESRYLNCRFTPQELSAPLKLIVEHLSLVLRTFSKTDHVIEPFIPHYTRLLIASDIELVNLEGLPQVIELLHDHRTILERPDIKELAMSSGDAAVKYPLLYYKLSDYHRDEPELVREYHARILRDTNKLDFCEPSTCTNTAIGNAHFFAASYKDSVYFHELALQNKSMGLFNRVSLLMRVRDAYLNLNNASAAIEKLDEIMELYQQVIESSASVLFANNIMLNRVITMYRDHNRVEEALYLRQRQLEAIREIGAKSSVASEVKELVESFFKQGNYTGAADLAQFGLESMKHQTLSESQQQESAVLKLDLELLVGRSKFHAGNYSEGLDYIEVVVAEIYRQGPSNYQRQLMHACRYILIFRARFDQCGKISILNPLLYDGSRIMHLVFGVLLDPLTNISVNLNLSKFVSPLQAKQEVPMTAPVPGNKLTLYTTQTTTYNFGHTLFLSVSDYLHSLLHSWLESFDQFLSQPVVWLLQSKFIRFVVNVFWVFTKLLLVLYTCKWVAYHISLHLSSKYSPITFFLISGICFYVSFKSFMYGLLEL